VAGIDNALPLERATLTGTPRHASADPSLWRSARILVCAQLAGCAEAALKLAVDYAQVREQFGQVIARFQALKHMCADMAVRCEATWSQTLLAALSLQGGRAGAAFEVEAAELLARTAAIDITEQCIQLHGGIGFTAECDAHRFLKRAHLLVKLLGDARAVQSRLLAAALPE